MFFFFRDIFPCGEVLRLAQYVVFCAFDTTMYVMSLSGRPFFGVKDEACIAY